MEDRQQSNKRQFTAEFNVTLVRSSDGILTQVARELGLNRATLRQ